MSDCKIIYFYENGHPCIPKKIIKHKCKIGDLFLRDENEGFYTYECKSVYTLDGEQVLAFQADFLPLKSAFVLVNKNDQFKPDDYEAAFTELLKKHDEIKCDDNVEKEDICGKLEKLSTNPVRIITVCPKCEEIPSSSRKNSCSPTPCSDSKKENQPKPPSSPCCRASSPCPSQDESESEPSDVSIKCSKIQITVTTNVISNQNCSKNEMSCENKEEECINIYFYENGTPCNPKKITKKRCELSSVVTKNDCGFSYCGKTLYTLKGDLLCKFCPMKLPCDSAFVLVEKCEKFNCADYEKAFQKEIGGGCPSKPKC